MTALENAWVELYLAFMILVIYIQGTRTKSKRFTASWYLRLTMINELVVIGTDIILWLFEYFQNGVFVLYELLWTINFILFLLMVLPYSLYQYSYIKENYGLDYKYPIKYFFLVFAFFTLFWISSYWNGLLFTLNKRFYPTYTSLYGFVLLLILLLLAPSIILTVRVRKKVDKREAVYFSLYSLIPVIALFIEVMLDINCIFYSSTCLSVLLMYVGVSQKNRMVYYKQKMEVQKKESDLREIEQKVMMGNIQPLFIQSVLASIADMAPKDPKLAEKSTENFASYLRMNLNSVGKNQPVPFEEELKHAQLYLELESNIRPGKLNVETNIETVNFFLPVLTLQPIVENAVVHGIFPKDGGTVKLWSKEDEKNIIVGIEDDGIGFDPSLVKDGIGIENTRDRIVKFCNGTLSVESEKGKGTRVTIIIPKNTYMQI